MKGETVMTKINVTAINIIYQGALGPNGSEGDIGDKGINGDFGRIGPAVSLLFVKLS